MTFQKKAENFWYYYKWHTIASVAIIITLFLGIKSCVDKVEPDVSIAYIASGYVNTEMFDDGKRALEKLVGDINGDGKEDVFLNAIMFSDEVNPQMTAALTTKAMFAIAAGESRVYILDLEHCETYADSGAFEPLEKLGYTDGLRNEKGELYAVRLEHNERLNKLGFNDKIELYAALRVIAETDAGNKNIENITQGARKIFEYIMNK
ncbi:MAG: hypothetical protein Q4C12_06875 [Clostridia bacterium]|nr:hypothetical protein [Clostridia bacterium]